MLKSLSPSGTGIYRVQENGVISKLRQLRVYRKLERKYRRVLDAGAAPGEQAKSRKVWICWLQGFESAPDLVKACYQSAKRALRDYDVVALDNSNIRDYVQLPDYIEEKRRRGIISPAHYSDIIRTCLLCRYGGLWIDATVLCTSADIMEVIDACPLFVYKQIQPPPAWEGAPILCSNWCIAARSNHPILLLVQNLLFEYWRQEKKAKHYFFYHMFLAMAARRYASEWERIPVFSNSAPHVLQVEFHRPYSSERWEQITRMSSFHKLNHHDDFSRDADSFYTHVIQTYLNA